MKNLYEYIDELTLDKWHYYHGVASELEVEKPFISHTEYSRFILNFFEKGGKVEIFKMCNIKVNKLRLPNHICSVFFLGIILYNETEFSKNYKLESSVAGYEAFPFIWFLIALFHDNAYQMEAKNKLKDINSISTLIKKFKIEYSLFDRKFAKCRELLNSRKEYFQFRKDKYKVVDHGILGGALLYDRLVKIRRQKKKSNDVTLFWDKKLENQYLTAANAISIHNIWLQSKSDCNQYNLRELLNFKPVMFKDFPMFYILGIIDTIEPLKTYKDDNLSDIEILKSFNIEFGKKYIRVIESDISVINFQKILKKVTGLAGWLDVKIEIENKEFKVTFR